MNSDESQDFLYNLSSTDKTFHDYKQSHNTNEYKDKFENQKKTYQSPTRRILSEDSEKNFEIVYEIHSGFTSEQILIIENALQIVVNGLFKSEILQNMYKICKTSGCCLTDQLWTQSNLTNDSFHKDKHLLLQYQLMCLKIKSENGELPTINIYPTYGQNEKGDKNCSTSVSCICHGSSFFIDGEFEIELNQNELNGSDQSCSKTLFWASVIVYEILRNLGHRSDHTCNSDQSQINVFKNCFLHDGNYLSNKTK